MPSMMPAMLDVFDGSDGQASSEFLSKRKAKAVDRNSVQGVCYGTKVQEVSLGDVFHGMMVVGWLIVLEMYLTCRPVIVYARHAQ